ncbi:MAG: chemotaxis protein CheW [Elainellaceae cyanobacterium]
MNTTASLIEANQPEMVVSSHSRFSKTLNFKQREKAFKLVVFTISGLNFALRIESVNKVVNHTRVIYSNDWARVGIAHVGDFEITVFDLQEKLTPQVAQSVQTQRDYNDDHYLIIAQSSSEELIGIPVNDAPILMEVPISQIRELPESYRRAEQLNMASHVTLIAQESEPMTVFLMDIDRVLAQVMAPAEV